jgi:hypothetical protein
MDRSGPHMRTGPALVFKLDKRDMLVGKKRPNRKQTRNDSDSATYLEINASQQRRPGPAKSRLTCVQLAPGQEGSGAADSGTRTAEA